MGAVAAWSLLSVLCGPAWAQSAAVQRRTAAEALFQQATALFEQRKYDEACPKFEEVVQLQPGKIGALLWLADCYEAWGKLASAHTTYDLAEVAAVAAHDARAATARTKKQNLAPRIPRLTISVVASVQALAGLEIKRDGLSVGQAQWGVAIPIDPGAHTVTASAPGKTPWTRTVEMIEGKPAAVEISELPDERASQAPAPQPPAPPTAAAPNGAPPAPLPRPPAATPSEAPAAPRSQGISAWAWASGGAGLALLGGAIGFGVDGLNAVATLKANCGASYSTLPCLQLKGSYQPNADNARKNRDLGLTLALGGVGLLAVGASVLGIVKGTSVSARPASAIHVVPLALPSGGGAVAWGTF